MSTAALTATQKSKSRTTLYNLIDGVHKVSTVGGASAIGDILFANIPLVTETVTIGDYWFGFKTGAAEAAGTSAGTEADPHLCSVDTSLDAVGTSLAAQILAETATTGAPGYLHPVDATGVDFTTATLTLTFYPGTAGNAITLAGSAGDETFTQPVTASLGVEAPAVSLQHKSTDIDTSASAQNVEYYTLADGSVGQEVTIVVSAIGASDTPRILGNFFDTAARVYVEAQAAGEFARYIFTGTYWRPVELTGGVTYTASA